MPRCASLPPVKQSSKGWLGAALLLAAATDAIPQALGQVAALEFAGSVSGSVDEAGAMAVGYASAKVFGLMLAPLMVARMGVKKALLNAVWGQVVCSLALAAMPGLALTFALRALQGLLGGVTTAASFGALVAMYPKEHHALAQGLWGVTTLVIPTVCAAAGGALTDWGHWQQAMLQVAPVGALAAVLLARWLPPRAPDFAAPVPATPWPWASLGLWAVVCALSQLLVVQGTRFNWTDVSWLSPVLCTLAAAAGALVMLQWRGPKNSAQAFFNGQPFAYGEFTFACATALISGYGATATAMLAPMYVRRLFGFSALDAGWMQLPSLAPMAFALVMSAVCSHKQWLSAMQMILVGMVLFLASLWLWSQATWQVDLHFVAYVVALRGAGLGIMAVPTARIAFARQNGLHAYFAAGYYQSARQWGGALATLTITWRLAETQARFRYHIASHLTEADPSIVARVAQDAAAVAQRGLDASLAPALGRALSAKALNQQVLVLSYNACFMEIFVVYGTLMAAALLWRARGQRAQSGPEG